MDEAAENRNYLARRMSDELNDIIRVLQLTTYDEDEWQSDDLTRLKKAQVCYNKIVFPIVCCIYSVYHFETE